MNKYKAIFDTKGNRITTYIEGIHDNIPQNAIEITEEEQALYVTNEYIRGTDGKPTVKPPYVPALDEIRIKKLAEIKSRLTATDYKCLKFIDGELTADEYAGTKALRISLRAAYNAIETATTLEAVNTVSY